MNTLHDSIISLKGILFITMSRYYQTGDSTQQEDGYNPNSI